MQSREFTPSNTQCQAAAEIGIKQLRQASENSFQLEISQSPRILAQRRVLQESFGGAIQRQAEESEDEEEEMSVNNINGESTQLMGESSKSIHLNTPINNTGMPDQLKAGIEALSGMDMSDVKVHHNSGKPAQLNALAYAQGNEIHLAPGQEQHLPHEVWHVVQQRQGRVQPTTQAKGMPINDDPGLEAEADVMGDKAIQRVEKSSTIRLRKSPQLDKSPVLQAVFNITSDINRAYNFNPDFRSEHVGTAKRAKDVLKLRSKRGDPPAPVTTIPNLNGLNLLAREVPAVRGGDGTIYDFSIQINVNGHTASWQRGGIIVVPIMSTTLSGFNQPGGGRLITHISSSS